MTDFEYTGSDLEVMSIAKNYNRWILNCFHPYMTDRVIEVGAGQGTMSQLIAEKCKHFIAIEPDEKNCQMIQEKLKDFKHTKTFHGFLSDFPKEAQRANSIVYINVLEHIEDEVAELTMAKQLLAENNGYLLIFVPALQALYGAVDRQVGHYRRYSKKYLTDLLENKLDMKIIKIKYFDIVGVLPWYILSCLMKLTGQNPTTVKIYDKVVVPIMSKIEKHLPMPIGKNIYAIATLK
jgi:16S rRNA A1518/A1519 N6-dimethyltransferase RsmA/KsgA/DIM1 with predicted DNA glycosylase/AP lyase activity